MAPRQVEWCVGLKMLGGQGWLAANGHDQILVISSGSISGWSVKYSEEVPLVGGLWAHAHCPPGLPGSPLPPHTRCHPGGWAPGLFLDATGCLQPSTGHPDGAQLRPKRPSGPSLLWAGLGVVLAASTTRSPPVCWFWAICLSCRWWHFVSSGGCPFTWALQLFLYRCPGSRHVASPAHSQTDVDLSGQYGCATYLLETPCASLETLLCPAAERSVCVSLVQRDGCLGLVPTSLPSAPPAVRAGAQALSA